MTAIPFTNQHALRLAKLNLHLVQLRRQGFGDGELSCDDIRPALEAAAHAGPNTGCIAPPPPLVREAFHLGELSGEASGYRGGFRSGWRWGAVCGLVFGTSMVGAALLLGQWAGA